MLCEVFRRSHDREAEIRSDADRDHVLIELLTEPDACVIAICHDVVESLIDDELDPHIRILRCESLQHAVIRGQFTDFVRTQPH